MIIKIPIAEKDIVSELCIKLNYKFRFLTMENNPLLVQCQIDEISEECSYHFGRMVQLKVEMECSVSRIKKFPYNIL